MGFIGTGNPDTVRAMVSKWPKTYVWPTRSPYASIVGVSTLSVLSPVVEYSPDVDSGIWLPANPIPILKAYDNTGTEVTGDVEFHFGVLKAGRRSVEYAPNFVLYQAFLEMALSDQGMGENRKADGALAQQLGDSMLAREGDKIVIAAYSTVSVVDLSQGATVFRTQARIGRLTA